MFGCLELIPGETVIVDEAIGFVGAGWGVEKWSTSNNFDLTTDWICELVNTNTPNPFPCLMLGGQTCQFRSTDNVLGKNKWSGHNIN